MRELGWKEVTPQERGKRGPLYMNAVNLIADPSEKPVGRPYVVRARDGEGWWVGFGRDRNDPNTRPFFHGNRLWFATRAEAKAAQATIRLLRASS